MTDSQIPQDALNLKDLRPVLKMLGRNAWLIVLLGAMGYTGGKLVTHRQDDIFAAQSEVLLEPGAEYVDTKEVLKGLVGHQAAPDVQNQMRILRSRDLVRRAVEKIDHHVTQYLVGRVRALPVGNISILDIKVDAKRFSWRARSAPFDVQILDNERYQISCDFGDEQPHFAEYTFGQWVETGDYKLNISLTRNTAEAVSIGMEQGLRFTVRNDQDLINAYRNGLKVDNVLRTSIVVLNLEDIMASRAVEFLDALINTYIDYTAEARTDVNQKTEAFIDKQLFSLETAMDSLQNIIDQEKADAEVLDLTRDQQQFFTDLVDLESTRQKYHHQLQGLEALEKYLSTGIENTHIPPTSFLSEDRVASTRIAQLYDLRLQRTQMLLDVTPKNMEIRRLDSLISTTRWSLFQYITDARVALKGDVQRLDTQIKFVENRLKSLPRSQRDILAVERRLRISDEFYGFLLQQKANIVIARAGIVPNASIIERARSIGVVGPDKQRTVFSWAGIGLIIGLAIGMIRMLVFERIDTVGELREMSKLPVSGGIPQYEDAAKNPLVVISQSRSPVTEAFRHLRTNLQYLLNRETEKVILITSLHPGEGKTFTATNLAAILATAGKRVVLIDFDLHKPRVHRVLDLPKNKGLSTLLIGRDTLADVLIPGPVDGLDVIPSGPVPPNASELVLDKRVGELLEKLREDYDFILLDTPPILLITDAMALMQQVDRGLIINHAKRTNTRGIKQLEGILSEHGVGHVSLLLNGILPHRWLSYGGRYATRYLYQNGHYRYGYSGQSGYGYGEESAE
jgi:capsular exopolysaccharide synthesis family protein